MLRSDPQEIEVTVVFDDDDTESTKPNFPLIFFSFFIIVFILIY